MKTEHWPLDLTAWRLPDNWLGRVRGRTARECLGGAGGGRGRLETANKDIFPSNFAIKE